MICCVFYANPEIADPNVIIGVTLRARFLEMGINLIFMTLIDLALYRGRNVKIKRHVAKSPRRNSDAFAVK